MTHYATINYLSYTYIPISFFIFLDSIIPNGSKTNKFKSATQKYSMLPTYQKVCINVIISAHCNNNPIKS